MTRRKRLLTLCLGLNKAIYNWQKSESFRKVEEDYGYRIYSYWHSNGKFEFRSINSAKQFLTKILKEAR